MNRGAGKRLVTLLMWMAGVLGYGASAHGHELQPGYLELRLIDSNLYAVVWKTPARGGGPMDISARLPERCTPRTPGQSIWDGAAYVARWTASCPGGLEGGVVEIDGLERTSTDVLVRYDFVDGASGVHRLTAGEPSFTVPSQPGRVEVAWTYLLYGIEHILLGVDHLLFVLALLLLVKGWRRIVGTITAFTIAHSITLAATTLNMVHVPGPPVEAAIALSIVFVAAEIIHGRQGRSGAAARWPWIVAFTFGLLHGFGFASALGDVGLPSRAIPLALFFFNVGVEAGQLLFVAAVAIVLAAASRVRLRPPRWVEFVPAYAIGGLAMFWFFNRISAF